MSKKLETLLDTVNPARMFSSSRRKKKAEKSNYAGFNRRMLAATIDSILLMTLNPVYDWLAPIRTESLEKIVINRNDPRAAHTYMMKVLTDKEFIASWSTNFSVQMMALCLFSAICWHFWSATPGKLLLRMRVVDAQTLGPMSDNQILNRLLGYFLSGAIFTLGFIWISIDKKKHQGWHDMLANTVVIIKPWPSRKTADAEPAMPPSMEPNLTQAAIGMAAPSAPAAQESGQGNE